MPGAEVEIVWNALSKAWRKAQYEELWLQFRPRGLKDVFEAVEAAVQMANQAIMDAGWDDVFTGGVSDSDAGPVALMSRAGTEEGVRAWFAAFAQHLETLGKSGRVTAAPEAFFPEWLSSGQVPQQLTAYVSYQTKDLALGVIRGSVTGITAIVMIELFPTRLRYSGFALAYGLTAAIFGGTVPLVATYLVGITANPFAPAFYLMLVAAISLATAFSVRETAPNSPRRATTKVSSR